MAITARQYLDGELRWVMSEKGLQRYWNNLNQLINSGTSAITTNIADRNTDVFTVFTANSVAAVTWSGSWSTTNTSATAMKVVPSDPGGGYGPHPLRGPAAQAIVVGRPFANLRLTT